MKKIGIIGAAGYTAGELIRLLLNHREVVISFLYSSSNAGNSISKVHKDLEGVSKLHFTDKIDESVDIIFLCLPHGKAKSFLLEHKEIQETTKIIDLSNDFRLSKDADFEGRTFVYALTELNAESVKNSVSIANPGCFATAIQLGLLPLAKKKLIIDDIHATGITGATGAGVSLSESSHFPNRDNNVSHYKAFKHQHCSEVLETLESLTGKKETLLFLPIRGNFSRGIFVTMYTKVRSNTTTEEIRDLYKEFYKESDFVHVSDNEVSLKQVVNTNNVLINVTVIDDRVLITCVIDNLLKGASGQAVENMNLMCGFDKKEGLRLKAGMF